MATQTRVRCQRIGCDATFLADENTDESACTYHPGPLFHDGGKEWSCCKKRSHDFSLFLDIPGCTKGKHTTEKPVLPSAPKPKPQPVVQNKVEQATTCSRCRQGFFCSDHGNAALKVAPASSSKSHQPPAKAPTQSAAPPPDPSVKPAPPKVLDLDAKQKCKHHGCGNSFTERENHDTACSYHPGPPVFHDRSRGWSCCDVHVKEFDEFMEIPPCAKGWHSST